MNSNRLYERNILIDIFFYWDGASKYVGSFEISRVFSNFVLNSVLGLIIFGPNEEAIYVVDGKMRDMHCRYSLHKDVPLMCSFMVSSKSLLVFCAVPVFFQDF